MQAVVRAVAHALVKRTHDLSSMQALPRQSHKLQNAFEDSFWSKHCSFQMNFRITRLLYVFLYMGDRFLGISRKIMQSPWKFTPDLFCFAVSMLKPKNK